MKKTWFALLAFLILAVIGSVPALAQNAGSQVIVKSEMELTLDGKSLALDESYLIENSLFVPYRAFSEGIGGMVGYDPETREVTVHKGETHVSFTIGSAEATVNGKKTMMVGPSTLINNSTFVHSRFLAETFGITVNYGESTRSVNLVTGREAEVKAYTVEISNFAFVQKEITVEAGSKVTFVNKDKMKHNAVADDGSFETALLEQGQSETITLDKPGVYTYYCAPHKSFMKGTITVK